jgi:cysteine-rich repeat protein
MAISRTGRRAARALAPSRTAWVVSMLGVAVLLAAGPARGFRSIPCSADCNGDGTVQINEVITCVNIALRTAPPERCPACDDDNSGIVNIAEVILAVSSLLGLCHGDVFDCCGDGLLQAGEDCDDGNLVGGDGCGPDCLHESCPLAEGAYLLTQIDGGTMQLATFFPIPLGSGGTLLLDVGAAQPPQCAHAAVVPFPNGLELPTVCIPGTGYSLRITATGCGIGQIDSNGGADYTISEIGDTSDASICAFPASGCPLGPSASDGAARVDVTVGDGAPDQCSAGTVNALVAIPVRIVVWADHGTFPGSCPASDGTYDQDKGDVLLLEFVQTLDFTSDAASGTWTDLDGDGCALVGIGPAEGFSGTGQCVDLETRSVTLVASGPAGSAAEPLRDRSSMVTIPHRFSGPTPPLHATCDPAPQLAVGDTVNRCIE